MEPDRPVPFFLEFDWPAFRGRLEFHSGYSPTTLPVKPRMSDNPTDLLARWCAGDQRRGGATLRVLCRPLDRPGPEKAFPEAQSAHRRRGRGPICVPQFLRSRRALRDSARRRPVAASRNHHPEQGAAAGGIPYRAETSDRARTHLQRRGQFTQRAGRVIGPDASPEEALILVEEVESLLRGLEPYQRNILELRLQGYNLLEIAHTANCSERTVRRVLDRIEQHLKQRDAGNS